MENRTKRCGGEWQWQCHTAHTQHNQTMGICGGKGNKSEDEEEEEEEEGGKKLIFGYTRTTDDTCRMVTSQQYTHP